MRGLSDRVDIMLTIMMIMFVVMIMISYLKKKKKKIALSRNPYEKYRFRHRFFLQDSFKIFLFNFIDWFCIFAIFINNILEIIFT